VDGHLYLQDSLVIVSVAILQLGAQAIQVLEMPGHARSFAGVSTNSEGASHASAWRGRAEYPRPEPFCDGNVTERIGQRARNASSRGLA
jgi:hypothetical protein